MSHGKHISSETHPSQQTSTSQVPGVPLTSTTGPSTYPTQKESRTDIYLPGTEPNLAERPLHEGGLPTTQPVLETESKYYRSIPGRKHHKEEVIERRQVFVEKIEKEPHHTRIVQTEERPVGEFTTTEHVHTHPRTEVIHDRPVVVERTEPYMEREPEVIHDIPVQHVHGAERTEHVHTHRHHAHGVERTEPYIEREPEVIHDIPVQPAHGVERTEHVHTHKHPAHGVERTEPYIQRQPEDHPLLVTEPQARVITHEHPERVRVIAPVSETSVPTEPRHHEHIPISTTHKYTTQQVPTESVRVIEQPLEKLHIQEAPTTHIPQSTEPLLHVHKYEREDPYTHKTVEQIHMSEHYTPEEAASMRTHLQAYKEEFLPSEARIEPEKIHLTERPLGTKCPNCNLEDCVCVKQKGKKVKKVKEGKEVKFAKGSGMSKPKHSEISHERAFGERPEDMHKLQIKEGKQTEIIKHDLDKIHQHERKPMNQDVLMTSEYPTNQTEGLQQMKNKIHEKSSEAAMGKKDKPIVPEPRTENYNQKERVAAAQKGAEHMKDVNKPYEQIAVNPRELYGPPHKEDTLSSAVEQERAPHLQKKLGNLSENISQGAQELSNKVFGNEPAEAGRGEDYLDLTSENIPPTQQFKLQKQPPLVEPIEITESTISSTRIPLQEYTITHPPETLAEQTNLVELEVSESGPVYYKYSQPTGDIQAHIREEIRRTPYEVFEGVGYSTVPDEIESQPSVIEKAKQGYEQMGYQFIEFGKVLSSEVREDVKKGKQDIKALGNQISEVFSRDTSKSHPTYKTYRFPEGFIELTPEQIREKISSSEGIPISDVSTNKPYQAKGMQPPNIPPMADLPEPQKKSTSLGQKVKNIGKSIKKGIENITESMTSSGQEEVEISSKANIQQTAPVTNIETAHGTETFEHIQRKPAYAGKEDSTFENIKSKGEGYQRYMGHKANQAYYRGEQTLQDYKGESDFQKFKAGLKAESEAGQAEGLRMAGQGLDKYEQTKETVSQGMDTLKNTVASKDTQQSESGRGELYNLRDIVRKEKADAGKTEKYSTEADESMERAKQKTQNIKSDVKETSQDTKENLKGMTQDIKEDISERAKEGHAFSQEYVDSLKQQAHSLKKQARSKGESVMQSTSNIKDTTNEMKDTAQTQVKDITSEAMDKGTAMKEGVKELTEPKIQQTESIASSAKQTATKIAQDTAQKIQELTSKSIEKAESAIESVVSKTQDLEKQALEKASEQSDTVKEGTNYITEKKHEAKGATKLLEVGAEAGKEAAKVAVPVDTTASSTGVSLLGYYSKAVDSVLAFKDKIMGPSLTTEQQQELIQTMETHAKLAEVSHKQVSSAKERSDLISEVIELGRSEIKESVEEKGLELKHPEMSTNKSLIDQAKEVIQDVKEYFEVEAAIMIGGPQSLKNLHFKSESEKAKSAKVTGFCSLRNTTRDKHIQKALAGRSDLPELMKDTQSTAQKRVQEGSKSLIDQAKEVIQNVKEYFEVEASLFTGGPQSLKNRTFKSESERAQKGCCSGSASFMNSNKDIYKEKADAGKSEASKKVGSSLDASKKKTEHAQGYIHHKQPELKEGMVHTADTASHKAEHALHKTGEKQQEVKGPVQHTAHHTQKSAQETLADTKHKAKDTAHLTKGKTEHTAHKGIAKGQTTGEEIKHDTKKRGVQAKQATKGVVQKAKDTAASMASVSADTLQNIKDKVVWKSEDTGQKMEQKPSMTSQKTGEGAEEIKTDAPKKSKQLLGKASETTGSLARKTSETTSASKDKLASKAKEENKAAQQKAHEAKKVMKSKGKEVKKSSEQTGHQAKKDLKDVGKDIKHGTQDTSQSVAQGSEELINHLKPSESQKASAGKGEDVSKKLEKGKENVEETSYKAQEGSKGLVQTVKETATEYASMAAETISSMYQQVTSSAEETKESVSEKVKEMSEQVQAKAKEGTESMKEQTQAAKESTQATAESMKQGTQQTVQKVQESSEGMMQEAQKKGQSAMESSKSTGQQVKEGAKQTGQKAKESYQGMKEGAKPKVQKAKEPIQAPAEIQKGPHLMEPITEHKIGKTASPSKNVKGTWTLQAPVKGQSPTKSSQKQKPPTKEDFLDTGVHDLEVDPEKGEKTLQHMFKQAKKIGSNKPMKSMKKLKNKTKTKEKEKASSGKPDPILEQGSETLPNLSAIKDREKGFGKTTKKQKPPTKEDFLDTGVHDLEVDPEKGEKTLQHMYKQASKTGSNKPMKSMKKLKNKTKTKEKEKGKAGRGENVSKKMDSELKHTGQENEPAGIQLKESAKETQQQATEVSKSWGETIKETAQEIGTVALEELNILAEKATTIVRKASDSLIDVKDKLMGTTEETSHKVTEKAQEAGDTAAKKSTVLQENVQQKGKEARENVSGKATEVKKNIQESGQETKEMAEKGAESTQESAEDIRDRIYQESEYMKNSARIHQHERGYGERIKDIEQRVEKAKETIYKERDVPLTGRNIRDNETAEDPRMGPKLGTQVPEDSINPSERDLERGCKSSEELMDAKNAEAKRNREKVEQQKILHTGERQSTTEKAEEKIGQMGEKLHENVQGAKESMASGLKSMLNLGSTSESEKAQSGREKIEKSSMSPPVSKERISEQSKGPKGDLSTENPSSEGSKFSSIYTDPKEVQSELPQEYGSECMRETDEVIHTNIQASKP